MQDTLISLKESERKNLEKDIQAFLKNGGKITALKIGESTDDKRVGLRKRILKEKL